ncbi:MAG TPA: MOSC N-terminal beta barrel domain-containing protein [Methylomirabilota bacterium]|nr:MOSC N-terminal beta barrel domain-containing protein [Methylomirabilota bacterium]
MASRTVGVVLRLWRYPVKSMLGERLDALDIDARGVVGDRLFALRDAAGKFGSGKSTRRFRRIDGLFGFSSLYEGDVPVIVFPDGHRQRGDAPGIHAALSAAVGQPVTLAREAAISHLDAGPLHLLTTASLAWLAAGVPDAVVDERRFRPNLVIAAPGARPVEHEWLGKALSIDGRVTLRVRATAERCAMVTFAQSDLPDDPRILRHIVDAADLQLGVYADVIASGQIRCGDVLTVVDE